MLKMSVTTLLIGLNFFSQAVASSAPEFSVLTSELCSTSECKKHYRQLKQFAKYGSTEAQNVVAVAYLTGNGLEKNTRLAIRNLRKAKSSGSARAAWTLSYLYKNGIGVEHNDLQANNLLQYAIDKNFGPAMFQKATELLDINKKDNDQAVDLLIKSSTKPAKYLLAQMYEYGEGIEQNVNEAARLYKELEFADYKDSKLRLSALVKQAKIDHKNSLVDPNIEVITVSGMKWDINKTLSTLVENLEISGLYDGKSMSKIRGKGCINSSSSCSVVTDKDEVQRFLGVFRR